MSQDNPAYTHPKMDPQTFRQPSGDGEPKGYPPHPVSDAAVSHAPASPTFDMSSTNATARVWPCAGGNSISLSDVPASPIAGPAEAVWGASISLERAQAAVNAHARDGAVQVSPNAPFSFWPAK